ncbi:HTTM domain-containing protein [Haladaptatus sp. GCM10025707]|uniref:HTTM domain-containing protein n=1 Tax=Haladaptatus sp. GCM10025707 TaxID=3252658 RepID=UPI00361E4D7E
MALHNRLSTVRDRISLAVRHRFEIDTRSLAVFRIAIGLLILADLVRRSRALTAFYTDFGVLPRTALISRSDPLHLSLHTLSGDAWVQAVFFLIAGVFAVALTIGYRTSAATIGSWIFLVSLHNRMPEVLNGGDFLLRLLLFWAMFLPLGASWAVDNQQASNTQTRTAVRSVAAAALLLQVVIMYSTNAAFKLSGDVWLQGKGLEYVFSLGQFTILFGDVLGSYPAVLHGLDYLWLGMITLSFLLIALPGLWRTGFVFLFISLHLGMLFTMRIDLFALISIAGLLPFLPAAFWDIVLPQLSHYRLSRAIGQWPQKLAGTLPVITVSGVPSLLSRWKTRLGTGVPLFFLVLIVLWNIQVLGYSQVYGHDVVPEEAESVIDLTRTDQYWNMFAPDPSPLMDGLSLRDYSKMAHGSTPFTVGLSAGIGRRIFQIRTRQHDGGNISSGSGGTTPQTAVISPTISVDAGIASMKPNWSMFQCTSWNSRRRSIPRPNRSIKSSWRTITASCRS